jgi:hypothetical protein
VFYAAVGPDDGRDEAFSYPAPRTKKGDFTFSIYWRRGQLDGLAISGLKLREKSRSGYCIGQHDLLSSADSPG